MSQLVYPRTGQKTLGYPPVVRPREPPIVSLKFGPKIRTALYFRQYDVAAETVASILHSREGGNPKDVDVGFQTIAWTNLHVASHSDNWERTSRNIGKYIASGVTDLKELFASLRLTIEEIKVGSNLTCASSILTDGRAVTLRRRF